MRACQPLVLLKCFSSTLNQNLLEYPSNPISGFDHAVPAFCMQHFHTLRGSRTYYPPALALDSKVIVLPNRSLRSWAKREPQPVLACDWSPARILRSLETFWLGKTIRASLGAALCSTGKGGGRLPPCRHKELAAQYFQGGRQTWTPGSCIQRICHGS